MADVQHILCANNMVQHLDIFFSHARSSSSPLNDRQIVFHCSIDASLKLRLHMSGEVNSVPTSNRLVTSVLTNKPFRRVDDALRR